MEREDAAKLENGSFDTNPFRNNFYNRNMFDQNTFSTNSDSVNLKQDSMGEVMQNFESAQQEYHKLMESFRNHKENDYYKNDDNKFSNTKMEENKDVKLWHKNQRFDSPELSRNFNKDNKPIESGGKSFEQIVEEKV